uniref:Peptidase A2 domain-containing protein n=1 Tax=Glossina austeni TaxID=7395 RepID=A0A1A9V0T3_GLOAU
MTSMKELINLQTATGGTIQRIIRNYKKDPVDRKGNASYYHEKHRILSELWDAFEATDGKLRILVEDQTNIEYFDGQYYEQIQTLTNEYLEIFSKEADRIKEAEYHEPPQKHVIKFNARGTALKRFLAGLENVSPNEPQQFYTIRIDTIKKLWGQVEDLYDEVWEQVSDSLINGLDQDNHEQLQLMPSPTSSTTQPPKVESNALKAVVTSAAANNSKPHTNYVLLGTARVRIIAASGNSAEFRAILDSGSQLERLTTNVTWMTLAHNNQWIYAYSLLTQAMAVCDRDIIPLNVKDSGLLTIEPECILQHDSVHISGHSSVTTTLAYTSLGELSELSQQDFVKDNSTATFNYSVLSNHYAIQLTELATIQHKLEVIKATTIQHPNSSNHNSRIAYSALAISVAAITILFCSMILLKKAVIAHITAATTHDNPQHEATPTPAPRTSRSPNFIVQV